MLSVYHVLKRLSQMMAPKSQDKWQIQGWKSDSSSEGPQSGLRAGLQRPLPSKHTQDLEKTSAVACPAQSSPLPTAIFGGFTKTPEMKP